MRPGHWSEACPAPLALSAPRPWLLGAGCIACAKMNMRGRCRNGVNRDPSTPQFFHAGQVSSPEQNAIVNGFPTSPYFAAAISSAASGNSSLSICSSRPLVDSVILSLPQSAIRCTLSVPIQWSGPGRCVGNLGHVTETRGHLGRVVGN